MKWIKKYESSGQDRLNIILDKISKNGYNSLTKSEKDFLENYGSEKEDDARKDIEKEEDKVIFTDSQDLFKFELTNIADFDGETHYFGTMYVTPYIHKNDIVEGELTGRIIYYGNGVRAIDFDKEVEEEVFIDIFDFIEPDYINEFDAFIDQILDDLADDEIF